MILSKTTDYHLDWRYRFIPRLNINNSNKSNKKNVGFRKIDISIYNITLIYFFNVVSSYNDNVHHKLFL